jgi:hypothetical protein
VTTTAVAPAPAATPAVERSAADRWARRALRVRDLDGGRDVHNIFSSSIALSAARCVLSYLVLPAVGFGAAGLVSPLIGLPVGLLALVFDVRAIRRFFLSDHRWRWAATGLYLTIMVMVGSLVVWDIVQLA